MAGSQGRAARSREGRDDLPIPYIERTRSYYLTLGYGNPYQWARHDDVPFTPLRRPLARTRLALVTTAAPVRPEAGDQGPGAPYNAAAKFYQVYSLPAHPAPDLRISHLGYDRTHTTAADPDTWLPLARLREAVAAGRIGELAPRTTIASPLRWSDDPSWKDDFSNADLLTPDEIARRRASFDNDKDVARGRRGEA
jgi:hypothetical protein